ncbi:MAG: hypothetical protein RR555_08505 [Bacteroidales bacterium]
MKKIAIVTASYAPISTPRAFRATELAREFARRGDAVTVYNCTTVLGVEPIKENGNIKIINLKARYYSMYGKQAKAIKNKLLLKLVRWAKKKLFYFTTSTWLLYLRAIQKRLVLEDRYDLLISVGLPFTIHWGVAQKIKREQVAKCCVADYGDPFSKFNLNLRVAKYFQWIERSAIKRFDYISVPTPFAIESYSWLKKTTQIVVIPQGFNFSEVKLSAYIPNKVPTFIYAGIFYSDIRNPKKLFDFLVQLDFDFRFIIYTSVSLQDSYMCIAPYLEKLKGRLLVYDFIPRLTLIEEMSKVDFIININNTSTNQIPSKLIDYALSKRPIFSCSPDVIDTSRFLAFCKNNYDGQDIIDIDSFDIRNVVDQFYSLLRDN